MIELIQCILIGIIIIFIYGIAGGVMSVEEEVKDIGERLARIEEKLGK